MKNRIGNTMVAALGVAGALIAARLALADERALLACGYQCPGQPPVITGFCPDTQFCCGFTNCLTGEETNLVCCSPILYCRLRFTPNAEAYCSIFAPAFNESEGWNGLGIVDPPIDPGD